MENTLRPHASPGSGVGCARGTSAPAVHCCLSRWLALFATAGPLFSMAASAPAQDVFVTRDAAGRPVFSDKGQPGAQPLTLPPLNVIEPIPVPPPAAKGNTTGKQKPEASPAAVREAADYQRLRIVFPEHEGSVAANTAVFEVRVVVEPPLQLAEGHAIVVSINGQAVGQRFTATEFMIPPEFWGDYLPPSNQRYQLDAAIVDRDGAVLKRAVPVSFYLRHVMGGYRRLHPPPHSVRPLPPPAAEKNKQPFIGVERLPPAKGREAEGLFSR